MNIYYYGTPLDSAGHDFYKCNGNELEWASIRFGEFCNNHFDPEEVPKLNPNIKRQLNNGDTAYASCGKYKIIHIEGGCYDKRGGTKTVFFTDEKILFGDFVLRIIKTPICKKIIDKCPFEINWGLNKEYTDKLNLILNEKINNMDKVIKDWKDNLSNEEWNDLLKKYDHYGHDIGINESELIDMYNNEMNQKKHYYLIDGKIMKSSSKIPPTRIAVTEGHAKTEALKYHYQELYSRWRQSLKPCEISEYELEKIKNNIIDYWFHESNPIEVTDIVEEKESISNLESFIYFKQPEKVESDEIKNLKLDILQILQEEATTQYNPEGKDSRVICSDEFETVANQIINLFKMQK